LRAGTQPARFTALVGTGGIGWGTFFRLQGNETLGREESRMGQLLDRRDYCKLHIICHYVKALLGDGFPVLPIGMVGDDEAGRRLLGEMTKAGLDLRFVSSIPGAPTLYSFCFLYPDGSGGNLTTGDSASAHVDPDAVRAADSVLAERGSAAVACAVPEVPLEARVALLRAAERHGTFRVASFTRAEMGEVRKRGLVGMADLLAVNLEEALAAAGIEEQPHAQAGLAARAAHAVERLSRDYPRLLLSITAGAAGSWAWDGAALLHVPPFRVQVQSAAGAGDAHIAGVISGLAVGCDLAEASQLAGAVAAASVTSPHSIHPGLTRSLIRALFDESGITDVRIHELVDELAQGK
jgi:sugar/nucleoside kinase (ribokinase family)